MCRMSARSKTLQEFFEHTGAETLAAIGQAPTTLGKVLHTIFALVCTGGLIANYVYFVQSYNKFETSTNVQVVLTILRREKQ